MKYVLFFFFVNHVLRNEEVDRPNWNQRNEQPIVEIGRQMRSLQRYVGATSKASSEISPMTPVIDINALKQQNQVL